MLHNDRSRAGMLALQLSTLNYQLSIDRERGRSHYNSQLSTLNCPMPYSQFTTIGKVKEAFNLSILEGTRFLPEIEPIELLPTPTGY
ncbi:MAG: hypothetical protein ACRC62_35535 [Microcoleus sp.]